MICTKRCEVLLKDFITDGKQKNINEVTSKVFSYDSNIKESESKGFVNKRINRQKKLTHLKFKFPILKKPNHKNLSGEDSSIIKRPNNRSLSCKNSIIMKIPNCKNPSCKDSGSKKDHIEAKPTQTPARPKMQPKKKTESISKNRGKVGHNHAQIAAEQILMNKEVYMKPFYKGWKRENVQRRTMVNMQRQSDIYYYAPCGKKLRSRIEIGRYLEEKKVTNLATENFTFSKFLIGAGGKYESQRIAASPKGSESGSTSKKSVKCSTSKTVKKLSPKNSTSSIKSLSKSEKSNSKCLSDAPSIAQPKKLQQVLRKRKLTIDLENESNGCHVKKKMGLRDRQKIQPPSRYEPPEDNSSSESKSNSAKRITHESHEKKIKPEKIFVESGIISFDHSDEGKTSVESPSKLLEDSDLCLDFPFGIDEGNDRTTTTNTNSTKSLLSEGNLPPFATPVEKNGSKPDIPLIQLNFEDLHKEDEGGGVPEDTNFKMKPFDPKCNSSKIRVRSMEELCDNTSAVAAQPSSINPVTVNFNINANFQNFPPVYKPILPSIPTIPLGQSMPYNNGSPISIFLNIPNFSNNNNNTLVDNTNVVKRHIYLPANYITGSNLNNTMSLQNGTGNSKLLRILAPVSKPMITPDFPNDKISNKKTQPYVPKSSASTNCVDLKFKAPVISPNARCSINGQTYELAIESNKPVLRPVSQSTSTKPL